ncbi:MAG: alpha-xylosidase [Propionicimonas sp.]|uniref:alpha-xylosidase n=1 Tax=Propionicimonas sp. TaxID=1955623 RepID=UPI003D0C357A
MKFTDGYWQVLPGMSVLRPRQVTDVVATDDALTVYAATRPQSGRGDTLNCPMLTVTYRSPLEGVIEVTATHHAGGREQVPAFPLRRCTPKVGITSPDAPGRPATFTSGPLTARVSTEAGWQVDFLAGDRVLTSSVERSMGSVTNADADTFFFEQLSLGIGAHVYGLGERFGTFVKNGQSIDIWNEDGGTASDQAYKNVPFYLTDAGYGVFVNHPERVSFEIGTEVVSRCQFSVPGESLSYFVIYGPTPKEILRRYTALTGRPAQVPTWSYGLWLSTSFTTDYDEATVSGFVEEMARRDLPLSVFHFDCFWMRQFHWCDFVWDPATFPDPEGMLARLHDRGLKISVWINPYIAQRSHLFEEGKRLGYLVRTPSGDVWQWDMWQAGMGLVDFTNPDAKAWFQDQLRRLVGQGVDAFKTDFGERIPTDVVWHDGSNPQRMHNYYTQLYNEAVFEVLTEARGEGDAVVFARSATSGGQSFPVHWGGDCESTFVAMAESLRGGLSLAASGFGFWSHDIGGFEGTPDPTVFKRWVAFGLLSSHSRLHGSDSYRVPWAFDEEAVEVTRKFTHLKYRLMPYLAGLGRVAHAEGVPVMRPMVLEFPSDRSAALADTQYMLGDALLVAPVFSTDGAVEYWLPSGTWTRVSDGEKVVGGRWVAETHELDSLPLLARPGSVVAWGARTDRPDYEYADGVVLEFFEPAEGSAGEFSVPTADGREVAATFVWAVRDGVLEVRSDAATPWQVRVGAEVQTPAGGRASVRLGGE